MTKAAQVTGLSRSALYKKMMNMLGLRSPADSGEPVDVVDLESKPGLG